MKVRKKNKAACHLYHLDGTDPPGHTANDKRRHAKKEAGIERKNFKVIDPFEKVKPLHFVKTEQIERVREVKERRGGCRYTKGKINISATSIAGSDVPIPDMVQAERNMESDRVTDFKFLSCD
mmetsp:Transcript_45645/g.89976  ORF Transcript_45645/g.89976 Transcript_45645/m.89976 type:complete len:123 (-) Transcript_45645:944-1312(-)